MAWLPINVRSRFDSLLGESRSVFSSYLCQTTDECLSQVLHTGSRFSLASFRYTMYMTKYY